ncbi:hypothetical protein MSAN_00697600 [Mycena sanguinolenta]|uniref:Uncharacterized protein n=1 Tax=Mycena sanguinolenta TaxID=230812 RepID=A0A8H7DGK9_9AGAR|nr:hypothetical protein MSAN_00697600 [Mycena sanguinolenta]
MPLFAGARLSGHERVDQARQTNPAYDAMTKDDDLGELLHFKQLRPGTRENHQETLKKWREFVEYHTKDPRPRYPHLPSDIEPGIPQIPLGALKLFLLYLAKAIPGMLESAPSRKSIQQHLYRFLACLKRYALADVPKSHQAQMVAFMQSEEMAAVAPLSTRIRPKPIGSSHDLDEMVFFVWKDKRYFVTTRSKAQFNGVNMISALTGQRPGTIMESRDYEDTNECIQWGDVTIIIVPNDDDPFRPHIVVELLFRNLKGKRGLEEFYQRFCIVLEPVGRRAACLGTIILSLALQDDVLADVHDIEAIVRPKVAPTKTHQLRIRETALKLPVFRGQILQDGVYEISPDRALTAPNHGTSLTKVSFEMGYKHNVTPYAWRRAAGNNFNSVFNSADRDALMTHQTGGRMFARSYQTRTYAHDFGAIFNGREQDPEVERRAQVAASMGAKRDPDAPTTLDLNDIAALDNEKELVDMRVKKQELSTAVANLVTALKTLPDDADNDASADIHARLRTARNKLTTHKAQYYAIRSREMDIRLKMKRTEWYEGTSKRQLEGTAVRKPLADKLNNLAQPFHHQVLDSEGTENVRLAKKMAVNMNPIDPHEAFIDALYNSHDPYLADEVVSVVNLFLSLPARRLAQCYPGEFPTADEKCPVCGMDCRRGVLAQKNSKNSIGTHIHTCYLASHKKSALEAAEEDYTPQLCFWSGCEDAENGTVFNNRQDFVGHIQEHTDEFTGVTCQWMVGVDEVCDEAHDGDLPRHFARAHSLNVAAEIDVKYCILCPLWLVDTAGDGSGWENHLWDHYNESFRPFATRAGPDVDLTPVGVKFTAAVDNAVDYQVGTGFDGASPEFHGHVVDGIALTPMECPWCVYDEDEEIIHRIKQWSSTDSWVRHVQTHDPSIKDEGNVCPVPSCGTHEFLRGELEVHMIAFHRVPLWSTSRAGGKNIRRLKLPPLPTTSEPAATVDLAHLDDAMDVDVESQAPAAKPPSKVIQKKLERRDKPVSDAVEGYCYGCLHPVKDIGRHINSRPKCWEKNEYRKRVNGSNVGDRLAWPRSPVAPTEGGRVPADQNKHFCARCKRQCPDIRKHVDECTQTPKPTHFKIITRVRVGTKWQRNMTRLIEIATWNPSDDSQPTASSGPAPQKRARSSDDEGDDDDDDDDDDESNMPEGQAKGKGKAPPKKRARRVSLSSDDEDGEEDHHESDDTDFVPNSKGKGKAPMRPNPKQKGRRDQTPDAADPRKSAPAVVRSIARLTDYMYRPILILQSSDDDEDDVPLAEKPAEGTSKSKSARRPPPSQAAIKLNQQLDPATLPAYLCVGCSQEFTRQELDQHFSAVRKKSKCVGRRYRRRNQVHVIGHKWSRETYAWEEEQMVESDT